MSYRAKQAAGLCIICGKKAKASRIRCHACLLIDSEKSRLRFLPRRKTAKEYAKRKPNNDHDPKTAAA